MLVFHGLNLSMQQIAQELNLNKDDAQHMVQVLRSGVVKKKPEVALSGVVECDEVALANRAINAARALPALLSTA